MVDKRPTRRKRRAPPKKASARRAPPKNASVKRVPPKKARAEPKKGPRASAGPLERLMHIPHFRRRVIRRVVRKLV